MYCIMYTSAENAGVVRDGNAPMKFNDERDAVTLSETLTILAEEDGNPKEYRFKVVEVKE